MNAKQGWTGHPAAQEAEPCVGQGELPRPQLKAANRGSILPGRTEAQSWGRKRQP